VQSLAGWGLQLLQLTVAVGAAFASFELAAWAWAQRVEPLAGFAQVRWVLAWIIAGGLAAYFGFYCWRRFTGLGLLLAMFTDQNRLRRTGGRPPVWLDAPPAADGSLTVAHLSDLHLGEGRDFRLIEDERPVGNAAFERLLDTPELGSSDLIVFTGDITDRGTAGSWDPFVESLEKRGLADRTVLVPGNHDVMLVNLVDSAGEALSTDRFAIVQLANLVKFFQAFARTFGGQRGIVTRDRALGLPTRGRELADSRRVMPFLEAWKRIEHDVRPLLESLPFEPVPPLRPWRYPTDRHAFRRYEAKIEKARTRLLALFPIAVPVEGKDALLLVLNSSTLVSRHPAANAFGRIGDAQHQRLTRLVTSFPQRLRLLAVHHHLVRRGEELATGLRQRVFARFAVMSDAFRVVRFCRKEGIRAVLNGHRHLSYHLRLPNGTLLLAAPSSTLGDDLTGDSRPGFERYVFDAAATDGMVVAVHRSVVRLEPVREEGILQLG